jgi:hypothetical protein
MAAKKDGSLHFCMDYRKLNAVTVSDAFPLPLIDDVLSAMQGARYFSSLDMKSGFWQLSMEKENIKKTAFVTAQEHYKFVRMPFGLKNTSATFQRAMTEILRPAFDHGTRVFVDDVVIFGSTVEQLLERMERAFGLLEAEGLTLTNILIILHVASFD